MLGNRMSGRQAVVGMATVLMGISVALLWQGCGSDEEEVSKKPRLASRPVEATGPGTQPEEKVVENELPAIPPDLKRIPDPGQAIAATMPDGKLWQKFPNGLAFQELHPGESGGRFPQVGQTVRVKYIGTLPNGTEFDRSNDYGLPFQLGTVNIIPGWNIAVQSMRIGSKRKVWIPAGLAYGPGGRGKIGPNQDLIFEMELLDISGKPVQFPEAPASLPALQLEGPALPPSTKPAATGPAT